MKNTLLKLIAVLALCFMIGGVLVACGGGESAGTSVEIKDGYWYVDGVNTGVKAEGKDGVDGKPGADATVTDCEHDYVVWSIEDHTATEDGKNLYVCNKCGHAQALVETVHAWVESETATEATCDKPSFIGSYCEICGVISEDAEEVAPALGHDWTEYSFITGVGETICADGGIQARHCTRCFAKESSLVEAIGHKVDEWTVETDALLTKKGMLTGACKNCGTTKVPYELPVLNDTDYTVETVAGDCTNGGTITYTFNGDVEYSVVLHTPKVGHLLNGQNYENYDLGLEAYVVLPYWYGTAAEDGTLPALGLTAFADAPFECKDTYQDGWFECEACEQTVGVKVLYNHNGATTLTQKPTCDQPGSMTVDCANCDFNGAVEIPVDHKFEYTLVGGTLAGVCACGATDNVQDAVEDFIATDIVAPTCVNKGVKSYTYIYKSGDKFVIETRELAVAETAHKILNNGEYVLADTLEKDGLYSSNIAGIKAFADKPFDECGKTYEGYFKCGHCEDNVYVNVIKDHVPAGDAVVVEPTCTENGSKTFTCKDCLNPAVTEVIDALGHNVEEPSYKLEKVGEKYVLTTMCSRKDCGHVISVDEYDEAEREVLTEATCKAEGTEKFTVTLEDGTKHSVEGKIAKTSHTLNGMLVDSEEFAVNLHESGAFYATTPGLKNFADNEFKCEDIVAGCYECEFCEELVYVQVYQNHNYDLNAAGAVKPTCTENGSAPCTLCNEIKTIDALGHTYTTTITDLVAPTADSTGTATYSATCSVCDAETAGHTITGTITLPELDTEDAYTVVEDKATCVKPGLDKYSYVYNVDSKNKVTVNFTVEVPADGHAAYLPTDKILVFELDNAWYQVYICSKCGEYQLIASGEGKYNPELQ